MTKELVVFVTTGSEKEAKEISHKLIQEELAACVNLVPTVQSIFQWEGKITEDKECLLIIKTTNHAFHELEAVIKAHHSYSVPEIIALPIDIGSLDYLSWVRQQVKSSVGQESQEL